MLNKSLFSSNSNEWETPIELFKILDNQFHFTLDPCASDSNHKCRKYYTINDDGLSKSWYSEIVFCNPPYGREINKWVKKAYNESLYNNALVVMLIPSRTDTKYFHDFILDHAYIKFIKGRLKFGNSKTVAPFPSLLCLFTPGHKKIDLIDDIKYKV